MSYDVNSLEAHWMPFSANRDFKANPRMVVKSEGMYMWDYKGGQIIDGSSAWFCTPAGHGRREIAEAVYYFLYQFYLSEILPISNGMIYLSLLLRYLL